MTTIPKIHPTERCSLAECPVWDALGQRLIYIDLADPHLVELDVRTGELRRTVLSLPPPLGGLYLRDSGKTAVVCADGVFGLDREYAVDARLYPPHASFSAAPPNDSTIHRGHVFVATADRKERLPTAGLFLLDRDNSFRRLLGGLTVGNGPAFAPDGRTMYLADSPRGVITAYDWRADCLSLENPRVFASVQPSDGLPDGLAVDASGGVWNARWGGGSVVRYAPNGTEKERIDLPARFATSCAFGGENLRTLFITTARGLGVSKDDLGGHLFSAELEVSGLPASLA